MSRKEKLTTFLTTIIFLVMAILFTAKDNDYAIVKDIKYLFSKEEIISKYNIPLYDGKDYVVINGNEPIFDDKEFDKSFTKFSDLDSLGRCGEAYGYLGYDLMPTLPRESIGSVKPSGWQYSKYDFIENKYLYNRCHLIAFQLTGENANEKNLITCTRYMNSVSMLEFENKVANYIRKTHNHVLYRVTPIFDNDNLVASGVQMEAYSVEDNGKGVKYNIFVYNIQPNIEIDYKTGKNWLNN